MAIMGSKEKLVERFKKKPKDFSYEEMLSLLASFDYHEYTKGSTSGSRVGLTPRFVTSNFLLQGKLYPYIGYGGADTPKTIGRFKTKDVNSEFTYGASAEASVGFSLKSSIWFKLGNEYKGYFYISSLSSSTLNIEGVVYKKTSSDSYENDENWNNGNGSSSSSGDISYSGEAPNFLDFIYTYTTNSVTVQLITDTKPTKGTIYYGKTSPTTSVSTTVFGRYISARITGLTKAEIYYVKCIATNEYGSTTSDALPVMTGSN